MNKVVNNVMKVLLVVAAVALAWMSYRSIMTPIEFNEIKEQREDAVIERLKDIRIVENEYRKITGDYTDNIDTLLHWLKTADALIIVKEGELTDKQLEEGLTEAKMWEMEKAKKAAEQLKMENDNQKIVDENFMKELAAAKTEDEFKLAIHTLL